MKYISFHFISLLYFPALFPCFVFLLCFLFLFSCFVSSSFDAWNMKMKMYKTKRRRGDERRWSRWIVTFTRWKTYEERGGERRGEEKGEERRVMSCASIILQRDVRTHVNRAEQTRREKNRTEQTRREQNRIDYNRTEQNRIEQNRIE